MATCYIPDDQYGNKIYEELEQVLPERDFPIKENVYNPLPYVDEIEAKKPDYILLDNYFPWENREEALGDEFLSELLARQIKTKIVCISDYGKKLLERYYAREHAYQQGLITGRVSSKNGSEIARILQR